METILSDFLLNPGGQKGCGCSGHDLLGFFGLWILSDANGMQKDVHINIYKKICPGKNIYLYT